MSEAIKATIAELQNQIRTWEQEIQSTKKVVNALANRAGMPQVYADSDLLISSAAFAPRRDQFYGKTLTTAMREYLQMRQGANLGPATINDLFDGLVQGGFDHGSANDDNAKRVMRITLTKNSSIFHRLPDDKHFGLTEWYPNVRTKKAKDEDGAEEASAASKDAESKDEPPLIEVKSQPSADAKPAKKDTRA